MNGYSFSPAMGKLKAELEVVPNGGLALTLERDGVKRKVIIRDFLSGNGRNYRFFHGYTRFAEEREGCFSIRTPAIDPESGAPVPGLLLIYRLYFDADFPAVYVGIELSCDAPLRGYHARIGDFIPEGDIVSYSGYEYGANGEGVTMNFSMPEKDPEALSYDDLLKVTRHTAWEKQKTRPVSFRRALGLNYPDGGLCVFGGTPTFDPEAGYVSVFPDISEWKCDLRTFGKGGEPGFWLMLTDGEDVHSSVRGLEKRTPLGRCGDAERPEEEKLEFRSGELCAGLVKTPRGISVSGAGGDCRTLPATPLFNIGLYDVIHSRARNADSSRGWSGVRVTRNGEHIRIILSDPENGEAAGISVIVEGFADPRRKRIEWKTRVVNESDVWSVLYVSYPVLRTGGYENAFFPIGSGSVFSEFCRRSGILNARYPLGVKINMAFSAFYSGGRGIYAGIHDPEGGPKTVSAYGAPSGAETFIAECRAPYEKRAGNSFTLPGYAVWQAFEGDWYDACLIYREFVHSSAEWAPRLRGRPDVPEWMRNTPVWLMHFMPNENPDAPPFPITLREKYPDERPDDWYEKAAEFKKKIGTPVAYHLYNWHYAPFNNDNPNYFPVHHDFAQGMEKLKEEGIRVIPYMAAYSWDMRDCRGDDFRFSDEARPFTAKNCKGDPISKSYASKEPDGTPVRFARMCPSSAFWKREVGKIVKRLFEDYGADGIYLDVVSAQYESCYDESHLHAPGAGTYWHREYDSLIAGLRAKTPESFVVLSESCSEVYTSSLDGMLSWTWSQSDRVPAFMTVYGGYVPVFGRVITQNKRDDALYFRIQIAQEFVYGQILGWVHPEIVNDESQFAFLKKLAGLRYESADFFAGARPLRPPMIEGDIPVHDSDGYLRSALFDHEKTVVAGALENGCRVLYVVNTSDKEVSAEVVFDREEYMMPLSAATSGDGRITSREENEKETKLTFVIEKSGVVTVKWEI